MTNTASEALARLRALHKRVDAMDLAQLDEEAAILNALPVLLDAAEALQGLHDDTVEYVTLNKLHDADGSPAINNHWMKQARAALASLKGGA